jgi:electron transport complex protein RnfD
VARPIEIRTAPHLKRPQGVEQIMRNVVYALLPVAGFSVWQFGISALALLVTCTTVAMLTERLFSQLAGRGNTLGDWSVVITGVLLALTLPPGFPLWMAAVAAFIAVALGKALFGGLGFNVMNPALVGRAFVQAAFPVAITTWTPAFLPGRFSEFIPSTLAVPFMRPDPVVPWIQALEVDGFTGATPLALHKFQQITTSTSDLLFGQVIGSTGETPDPAGGPLPGVSQDARLADSTRRVRRCHPGLAAAVVAGQFSLPVTGFRLAVRRPDAGGLVHGQ